VIFGLVQAAGGIGLFLLGMIVMTDGLRSLAGDALQRALRRFTRSPLSGAISGAIATAIVQSSSATTVIAVGFAGAGLLSFPQALGIVFGANIGTTLRGWLVALLGFQVHIGAVAALLVLIGVLLRLFARERLARAGLALAGFGLVFVGFVALQQGIGAFEGVVTPEHLPGDSLGGRLLLVGLGILITLVTQSSSAGVAAAIAAVNVGAISFPQAAAMVIGMDVGTTATAALATLGASLPARRTGWAHVIYNVLTAIVAFALLPVYTWCVERLFPGVLESSPELALVGFHTTFNVIGVIAVLPVAEPFARLVALLVPERPTAFAARLDRALLEEPGVALRAAGATLAELSTGAFATLGKLLVGGGPANDALADIRLGLAETQRYVARIGPPDPEQAFDPREVSALHVIDQLRRLLDRCEQRERIGALEGDEALRAQARPLADVLADAAAGSGLGAEAAEEQLEALEAALRKGRSAYRRDALRRASADELTSEQALARLDAWRWLERVAHHAWRVVHHLRRMELEYPGVPGAEPPEPD
jgi:phosphate:Na+ symporter